MSDQQFTAFCAMLVVIGLLSVSMAFISAWDLWHYGSSKETQR